MKIKVYDHDWRLLGEYEGSSLTEILRREMLYFNHGDKIIIEVD